MASPFAQSETIDDEEPLPHEADLPDRAAVWRHEIWEDGVPRSWISTGWMHVCGTVQGGRNIAAQLTKSIEPIDDHASVLEYIGNLSDDAHYMEFLLKWASLMSNTFLICIAPKGGYLGGLYKASAECPCEWNKSPAEVPLAEARRTFREHGLLLSVDVTDFKCAAILYNPEVAERVGGVGKLLKFTVAPSRRAELGLSSSSPAAPTIPQCAATQRVDDVESAAIERAERASLAVRAALRAASVY